jgi:acetyl coenzyme A synthetase (ADP forming)-like protein
MPKNLNTLFSPKSVVIVGASRSPEKVGAIVLKNIIDYKFKGRVYAVNPNTDSIGEIKCFKTVLDLPEIPDLAIISLPSTLVMQSVTEIVQKGIKNIVIFSAGFKETGPEGAVLEKKLEDLCRNNDVNLIGPNCLGYVNNLCPINATFAKVTSQIGNLRFISQSGALATSLFDYFSSVNLGFSEFITLGNKTILNENDILEYYLAKDQGPIESLIEDEVHKVEPIGMYLESISDGQQFLKLTKQIIKNNPIFIIKPGKTKAAMTAMQSHTGSIAGADDILTIALKQAGVYRCDTLEEFFDLSKAFAWNEMPQGPRVAIISNAGGPAVISADAVVTEGLEMAEFDSETIKKLFEVLPRSASILDPVDVLGDALADRFAAAAEIVLQTDKCDSLLVILTPQTMTQIQKTAEMIGNISKKYKKPVFCSFIGGTLVSEGEKELNRLKVPSYLFPERAITVIGAMWKFKKQQQKILNTVTDIGILNTQILPDKCSGILQNAINNNQKALDNLDANDILSEAGIQTPSTKIAEDFQDAVKFADEVGYPVVLKLSSPGLLHKKHIGGVVLDIRNIEQLEDAWNILERKSEYLDALVKEQVKFQIQKEIPGGVEVIVGIKRDPTFGPVLLFGAGGSMVELISDKNLRLLPLDMGSIEETVKDSKIYSVLKGNENEPPYALEMLYKLIFNLGKIYEAAPQIKEIEINPVIVSINNVWAVDPKVILESDKPSPVGPRFNVATTLKADLLAGKIRYFEFETEQPLIIRPGQYLSVKVSSTRINCYSVAGQGAPNKFNLLVDTTPGGPGSRFFESLKVNDKITYLGPFGAFTLKTDDGAKNLLFLATGSGLAPLKSMIEHCLYVSKVKQNIILYLGLNNYTDMFMKDYLDSLVSEFPNFKYKIAVCNKCREWKGYTGFITSLIKEDFPDAKECAAYMCGNKFMVNDATKILTNNGCPPQRIYFEKI